MRLLRRLAQGELCLTRIEAFSDGVFTIIVTLLVLELNVPERVNDFETPAKRI